VADLGPTFLIRSLLGTRSRASRTLAASSQLIIGRSFSRAFEREADEDGWKYLVAANINPHGFIDSLEKIKKYETSRRIQSSALSTHPATQERIEKLQARWKKLQVKTGFVEMAPAP
jgi:beta-barrel assembly-enhancing protease